MTCLNWSCERSVDQPGEVIPPKTVYAQAQRPELVVSYITQLLRESDAANLYYIRAKAYFQLRDYVHAQTDIEQALEKNMGDVDYLLLSVLVKIQLDLHAQALKDAKALESTGYSSPIFYLALSQLYLTSHSKGLASTYLKQATSLGIPKSEKAYATYLNQMIYGDSLVALKSIQCTDLEHRVLSRVFFTYQLPRMSQLEYQKLLLQELKKNPLDTYLLLNWARFLNQLRQEDRAIKVYLKALDQLPSPSLYVEIAEIYIRMANYNQALVYLNKVPKQTPNYANVMFNQALVYLYLGQKSRSFEVLDSARRMYVSDYRFINLRNRLMTKRVDSTLNLTDSTGQKSF